jgi:hypothetical protein
MRAKHVAFLLIEIVGTSLAMTKRPAKRFAKLHRESRIGHAFGAEAQPKIGTEPATAISTAEMAQR